MRDTGRSPVGEPLRPAANAARRWDFGVIVMNELDLTPAPRLESSVMVAEPWGTAFSFDVDAFTMLCDPDNVRARDALVKFRRLVRERRYDFVFTSSLAWEMLGARRSKPRVYHSMVREARRLSRGWLLNNSVDRQAHEIRLGRRLRRHEAFITPSNTSRMFVEGFTDPSIVDHDADLLVQNKDEWFVDMVEKTKRTHRDITGEYAAGASQWRTSFRTDPKPWVADWAEGYIEHVCRERAITRKSGAPGSAMPTIWARTTFRLGHMYVVGLKGHGTPSLDRNDAFDQEHFSDAEYADVFVTNDRRLARIVGCSARCHARLRTFDEWRDRIEELRA